MAPVPELLTLSVAAEWYEEQIVRTGFHGGHFPLIFQPISEGVRVLVAHLISERKWVSLMVFGDNDEEGEDNTFPSDGIRSDEAFRYFEEIAALLDGYELADIELGYDLHETIGRGGTPEGDDEMGSFNHQMVVFLGVKALCGGRALPGDAPYAHGRLVSIEQHFGSDPSDEEISALMDEAVGFAGSRPTKSGDRVRAGRAPKREKDPLVEAVPRIVRASVDSRVANIFGFGPNVSDTGSLAWPNREAMRRELGSPQPPPPPEDHRALALSHLTDAEVAIDAARAEINQI